VARPAACNGPRRSRPTAAKAWVNTVTDPTGTANPAPRSAAAKPTTQRGGPVTLGGSLVASVKSGSSRVMGVRAGADPGWTRQGPTLPALPRTQRRDAKDQDEDPYGNPQGDRHDQVTGPR
jgi:hypothetical protein